PPSLPSSVPESLSALYALHPGICVLLPLCGILELILTSWVHPAGRRERRMGLTWIGVAGGGAYFSDFGGLGGGC
ncbi:hypothetical protein, partial [Faecalicatena contorta]|uniref:hypothetical protein n=1 Tax=Faecalicatena contorta TaxID=39482 RepID=UPI001A9B37DD